MLTVDTGALTNGSAPAAQTARPTATRTPLLGRLVSPLPANEIHLQFQRVTHIAYMQVLILTAVIYAVYVLTRVSIDVPGVTGVLAGLHVLNLACIRVARSASRLPLKIWTHTVVSVLLMTGLIHYLGATEANMMTILYVVVMLNSQILLSTMGFFVHANLAAGAYCALLLLEQMHVVPAPRLFVVEVAPPFWSFIMAAATTASLNLVAMSSASFGRVLRERSDQLTARTRELAQANASLVEKAVALEERQEELRSFVYSVTHDLKNPVNAILLTTDLVLDREGHVLTAAGRDDLDSVAKMAATTDDMIRDLLGFFRITSSVEAPSPVDLNELVEETRATLRTVLQAKRIDVDVGALPVVWGQRSKLACVLANLLSNGAKYVSAGRGRLRITASMAGEGEVVLVVEDNGIGIAKRYHAGVFELFRRVPDDEQMVDGATAGGTGVGLALVKRIIEAHRGSVWVESEPGAGSRFYVRLPHGGTLEAHHDA
ncbi:MAG: hypothetical protein FJ148_23360 [Deltaproteobacteria bacterium]|nr:hypothetical protein [Deltaproteobacteria bacterium]